MYAPPVLRRPAPSSDGRRTGVLAVVAGLIISLLAFVPATPAERGALAALPGQNGDVLQRGERRRTRHLRRGRQRRHPLVERLLRPAVDQGRSWRLRLGLPDRAEVGGGLRHRLPDRVLHGQQHMDHRLLHHQRPRRHGDPERLRHGSLRPADRHRPGHAVRLLALGVPGVRHHRRPGRPADSRRWRPRTECAGLRPVDARHPGQGGRDLQAAGVRAVRERPLCAPVQAGHVQQHQRAARLLHVDRGTRPQAGRHDLQR